MDQELKQHLEAMEERLAHKIDQSAESLLRVMTDMETRLSSRLERLETSMAGVTFALAGMERLLAGEAQYAKGREIRELQMQRAIDDLSRRLTAIERKTA